jgi:hypothetical protein
MMGPGEHDPQIDCGCIDSPSDILAHGLRRSTGLIILLLLLHVATFATLLGLRPAGAAHVTLEWGPHALSGVEQP